MKQHMKQTMVCIILTLLLCISGNSIQAMEKSEEGKDKVAYVIENQEKISPREMTNEYKKLTAEEKRIFLQEVYGYSELQINGEVPILNENGNMFLLKGDKLVSILPTDEELKAYRLKEEAEKIDNSYSIESSAMEYMEEGIESDDYHLGNLSYIEEPSEKYELVEKRDIYTKIYEVEDGTQMAVIGALPEHYKKGDSYKEISVKIEKTEEKDYEYRNIDNSFRTYFNAADSLDHNIYTRYEKTNKEGIERVLTFGIPKGKPTKETVKENRVTYHNVFENVDIEYLINKVRLKENIYVKEPVEKIDYEFHIHVQGATPEVTEELDIEFIDDETGEVLWMMGRPYAEDSSIWQRTTKEMHYEIKEIESGSGEEKSYSILLVMDDATFLQEAVYPITIDPTFFAKNGNINMVVQHSSDIFGNSKQSHIVGFPNGSHYEYITYYGFNIDALPKDIVVTNAQAFIYPQGGLGRDIPCTYTAKRVTSNFSSAHWYNMPSTTSQNQVARYTYNYGSTLVFLIENMMNDAIKENRPFYGIEVRGEKNKATGYYTDIYNAPKLIVLYKINTRPKVTYSSIKDNALVKMDTEELPAQVIIQDDSPGNMLITSLYIDGVKKQALTGKGPLFKINMSELKDGRSTLRFEVFDGKFITNHTVNIRVDRHPPTIEKITLTENVDTANMLIFAKDEYTQLGDLQYRFICDGEDTGFVKRNSHTFKNLVPAKSYTADIQVVDSNNQHTTKQYPFTTLAEVPTVKVENVKKDEMELKIVDANEVALYQIAVNERYVAQDGTLIEAPTYISLQADKKVNIKGLEAGKEYKIKVKAKNAKNRETKYTKQIKAYTLGEVPAIVQNLTFEITKDSIQLVWDEIVDATSYEVSVDETQYTTNMPMYELSGIDMKKEYSIKVRAKNKNGVGEWSKILGCTPEKTLILTVEKDKKYIFNWYVKKYTTFEEKEFKLTYDKDAFAIEDICAYTDKKEKAIGSIQNQPITITKVTEDEIVYKRTDEITEGKMYTGVINSIELKAKKDGKVILEFDTIDKE